MNSNNVSWVHQENFLSRASDAMCGHRISSLQPGLVETRIRTRFNARLLAKPGETLLFMYGVVFVASSQTAKLIVESSQTQFHEAASCMLMLLW